MELSNLTDEEIVLKTRTLNSDYYSYIISRYQNKLIRYAKSIVRDENQSVDIVQESFIKAYTNLNGFDIKRKFSSWIYRIVHNEALNLIKKNKNTFNIPEDFDIESDLDIEEDYFKKELLEEINNCLDQISILYREPLFLFYIEQNSYEEISDILRIPMGTVATRINRAKKILKKICMMNKKI